MFFEKYQISGHLRYGTYCCFHPKQPLSVSILQILYNHYVTYCCFHSKQALSISILQMLYDCYVIIGKSAALFID